MAPKGLTKNQRWLLFHIGGWRIVDALAFTSGADDLLQSARGSTGGPPPAGGPAWLSGWDIYRGVIRSRHGGAPSVQITRRQLAQYIDALPAQVKDELAECSRAHTAITIERGRFCFCSENPCAYAMFPDYIHQPDPDRVQAADREDERIREWGIDVLRRALFLDEEQLQLFEVS
ncbi:hypothetical protein [Mycolicibacterium mageritense]|uniref:hypothetical protein n=1 Tax=Mycolicibacterium mageritense TaxID=53462 RepID=UPI0011D9B24A|nr:hypothetical protein [Mycolicibacterium mageritense]TXI53497.1 MAG: hypothetical protein E6Q55_35005 [Mycolicibacterium mageritense]